jgi:hypothetical protein
MSEASEYNPVENLLASRGMTLDSTTEAVAYDLNRVEIGRFTVTAADCYSVFDQRWSCVRLLLSDAVKEAQAKFPAARYFDFP